MRKIMLAATAIAGFSALAATAQAAEPVLTTDSFNAGLATGAALPPGTITVRLRALLTTELSYATDTFSRAAGTVAANGTVSGNGKNSGILLGSYMRLYPKFDAVAANGLEYGATMEARSNFGAVGNTGSGSTLYWRRYNGYVGTPAIGRFYFGAENNALARNLAGTTMEDFDANGGFNGDVPTASGDVAVSFMSMRGATFYTTNKLVYLSPSFAGFTFGASWEPSQNPGDNTSGQNNTAVLSTQTSSIAGFNNLRRNTFDVSASYKGSFGPVAIIAGGGYLQSGHVQDAAFVAPTTFNSTNVKAKDLKVFAFGTRITYGPFAVGGTFNTGDIDANGGGSLIRQGNKKAFNSIMGAQYIIGPVIMGLQYVNNDSAGNFNNGFVDTAAGSASPATTKTFIKSNLHETGIVVGGAYDWAPGATLFTSFLYGQRHQGGWNFGTASASPGSNLKLGNSVQVRAIQIGNTFKW
eukprot:gene2574-2614_t